MRFSSVFKLSIIYLHFMFNRSLRSFTYSWKTSVQSRTDRILRRNPTTLAPESVPGARGIYINEGKREDEDIDAEFYQIDVRDQHPKTESTAIKHCENFEKWFLNHRIQAHTIDSFQEAKLFVDQFYGPSHTG